MVVFVIDSVYRAQTDTQHKETYDRRDWLKLKKESNDRTQRGECLWWEIRQYPSVPCISGYSHGVTTLNRWLCTSYPHTLG